MIGIYLGELAALVTASSWALSCQLNSAVGKFLGAMGVTTVRMPLYICLMAALCFFSNAPVTLEPAILLLLCASAVSGLVICDICLYKTAIMIGPRLACLLQSLCACITALLGLVFLGESIGMLGWLGIVIAIAGVFFVIGDGGNLKVLPAGISPEEGRKMLAQGCLFGLLSAVTMAISLVVLKQAILLGANPMWATFVRLSVGGLVLTSVMLLRGALKAALLELKIHHQCILMLLAASCAGTFGIWMSGVAVQHTEAGVVATILAMQPILIIPINAIWDRRLPTLRAVFGTLVAFSGIAVMLMRNHF